MNSSLLPLQTHRLVIRQAVLADAEFILRLTNEPEWLQFIGDKNIRSLEAAKNYIQNSLLSGYETNGFGLWIVALQGALEPVGLCGLVNRDGLDGIDLGFAFLAEAQGKGYAFEASSKVLDYACQELELEKLLAITSPTNEASIRLLNKLRFGLQGPIQLSNGIERPAEELLLFERNF